MLTISPGSIDETLKFKTSSRSVKTNSLPLALKEKGNLYKRLIKFRNLVCQCMRTIWSTFLKFLHCPLIAILTVGSRLNKDSCTHGNGRYCQIVSVNSFCGDILGWNRTKGNS